MAIRPLDKEEFSAYVSRAAADCLEFPVSYQARLLLSSSFSRQKRNTSGG